MAAFELSRLGPHVLASLLQSWTVQLGRISDLLLELDMLRLVFPLLSSVECPTGAIKLTFLHLVLECKFAVVLTLGKLGGAAMLPVRLSVLSEHKLGTTGSVAGGECRVNTAANNPTQRQCAALTSLGKQQASHGP